MGIAGATCGLGQVALPAKPERGVRVRHAAHVRDLSRYRMSDGHKSSIGRGRRPHAYSASLRCRSSRGVLPNKAPKAVEKCDPDENPHISPTCTIE